MSDLVIIECQVVPGRLLSVYDLVIVECQVIPGRLLWVDNLVVEGLR